MSLSTHIAELNEKHKLLKQKIEQELARPSTDAVEIARMKREKLKLKDQIVRLSAPTRH